MLYQRKCLLCDGFRLPAKVNRTLEELQKKMSKTSVNRSTRAKVALVPVLSLGLLGASMALAAPAQAETTRYGCTVDPLDPKDQHGI